MAVETVRLNARARNQLTNLKRKTGIDHWNVLCRWAFCASLAEEHRPRDVSIGGEPGVEMTWKTFGGEYADLYLGLLKQRCLNDGIEPDEQNASEQLKLHLHRGIGYLASRKDIQSIEEYTGLILKHY